MADEQEVEAPAEEAVAVEEVQMSVLDALKEVRRRCRDSLLLGWQYSAMTGQYLISDYFITLIFTRRS